MLSKHQRTLAAFIPEDWKMYGCSCRGGWGGGGGADSGEQMRTTPRLLVSKRRPLPALSWAACEAFVFWRGEIHQPGLKSLHNEFHRARPGCLIPIAQNPHPQSLYLFIRAACGSLDEEEEEKKKGWVGWLRKEKKKAQRV